MNEISPGTVSTIRAVTAENVNAWFVEANNRAQHKQRKLLPSAESVARIVKLVNAQIQTLYQSPHDYEPLLDDLREMQSAIGTLRATLPRILERYHQSGPYHYGIVDGRPVIQKDEGVVALERILELIEEAVRIAPHYLGERPKGRPVEVDRMLAQSLEDPVRKAWESTGIKKVSTRTQAGPFVFVIRCAVEAITGREHEPGKIASYFVRKARRRKADAS
jgi:hypothetical protein